MGVDEDVVWEVVTRDLPPLISKLEQAVQQESSVQSGLGALEGQD